MSKWTNKLTICRTMLRVHHIFSLCLFFAIINSLADFIRYVLCDCRIYVLHTIRCLFVCVCLSVYTSSMHFTCSLFLCQLQKFYLFLSLSYLKSILFHLLRSVHAYYFSDYIKINGCSKNLLCVMYVAESKRQCGA